jgi:hypothetical protein
VTRLLDVVADLPTAPPDAVVVAVSPWSMESEAYVVAGESDAPAGATYMLEVSLAVEAIEIWSQWRNGRVPTPQDACEAVLYYASKDAYQPT